MNLGILQLIIRVSRDITADNKGESRDITADNNGESRDIVVIETSSISKAVDSL